MRSIDGEVYSYKRQCRRRGKRSCGGAAGNDAGWMKLPCESVKTHEREDVKADYFTSGQFLESFARSLMDRPNRLMKPAESAWL